MKQNVENIKYINIRQNVRQPNIRMEQILLSMKYIKF